MIEKYIKLRKNVEFQRIEKNNTENTVNDIKYTEEGVNC